MPPAQPLYRPRDAEHTALYGVVREHLDDFLRAAAAGEESRGLPPFIEREFRDFLTCGILAHGFVRLPARAARSSGWCPSPARAGVSARAAAAAG